MIQNGTEWNEFVDSYFDTRYYFKALTESISNLADYLETHNIKDVVIGVSGGVDSACVLAMLVHIKKHIQPLKIHAYCIEFSDVYPNFDSRYVLDLAKVFKDDINYHYIDGNDLLKQQAATMDLDYTIANLPLLGQISYAMRYTMLFGFAQQHNAITIGTTNYDEFGYAGWFGKNSDMMVDVQPITQLHKYEVQYVAEYLGVPDSITTRVPTGDLVDNSTDEDNFGCSYRDLGAFTYMMNKSPSLLSSYLVERFSKLIALHNKNYHKYLGQTFNPVFL